MTDYKNSHVTEQTPLLEAVIYGTGFIGSMVMIGILLAMGAV